MTTHRSSCHSTARTILVIALMLAAGCGGTAETAGDGAPPSDPATAIVGHWEFANEAGVVSYDFATDGTFRSAVDGRFQDFEITGRYTIRDGRVVLTHDDSEGVDETTYLDFVGSDRIRESDTEIVYRRQ